MNFYTLFTLSGLLYACHGIVYAVLIMLNNNYEPPYLTNFDIINFTYFIFRVITSILILCKCSFLNKIRYNCWSESEYYATAIGSNYTLYQKICFTAIAFMLCVQYTFHTFIKNCNNINLINKSIFYVDITSTVWLWYSMIYRIFVNDDVLTVRGNYKKNNKQKEPIN